MIKKPMVELEIVKVIDKFIYNLSSGHNNIGNFINENLYSEIVKPLASIFNLSRLTGFVLEN